MKVGSTGCSALRSGILARRGGGLATSMPPPVSPHAHGTIVPQRPSPASSPDLADYFSDAAIIQQLCLHRVAQAAKRKEADRLRQFRAVGRARQLQTPYDHAFPPRRNWLQHRPRFRKGLTGSRSNLIALKQTIAMYWDAKEAPPWMVELRKLVGLIREKALQQNPVRVTAPDVFGIPKLSGSQDHRPLAVYGLLDRIISSLAAKSLREYVEPELDDASMAFRCRRQERPAPRHHDAVRAILAFREKAGNRPLYVAECDIRGFFDVVDHQIARRALNEVISRVAAASPGKAVAPRALDLFDAYLDSYSFPRDTLRIAQPKMRIRKPEARFKWPEEDLARFHIHARNAAIGIPQGGAYSGLIANLVLDKADRALRALRQKHEFLYLRYCDDMIIIATSKRVCAKALKTYLRVLQELKLPVHPPKRCQRYGADHWDGKSREVYRWGARIEKGDIPWIQFVGYQIHRDGLIRVRKGSYQKHMAKLVEEVGQVVYHLKRRIGDGGAPIRKTARQIVLSVRMRMISMSVGRPYVHDSNRHPLDGSWCAGFECLDGQPLLARQLKALDRHREQQIRRLERKLEGIQGIPTQSTGRKSAKVLRYYGHPFSYFAQFRRTPAINAAATTGMRGLFTRARR